VSASARRPEQRRTRRAPDRERVENPLGAEERRARAAESLESDVVPADRALAGIASRQRGVVTYAQLRECGLSRHQIDHASEAGRLHRVHRGIFVVGHTALAPFALEHAAVLACGPGAVLSHSSSAHLAGIVDEGPAVPDVTVAGRRIKGKPGIRIHCVEAFDRRDIWARHGIPATTPARTLVDLSAILDDDELDRAVNEAHALKLISESTLAAALDRSAGRRGVARLRRLLAMQAGPTITESEAERLALKVIRAAGLPTPRTRVYLCGYKTDLFWPEHRLIVEIDGYLFHGGREAFESDRARDATLTAAGYRVIRFTWRQLVEKPLLVVATVTRALAGRAPH
jgi:very-short-patch-repair endonuclease